MKLTNYIINKKNVYDEVEKISSYVTANTENGNIKNMAVNEYNKEVLSNFEKEACVEISDINPTAFVTTTLSGETIVMSFELPDNHVENTKSEAENALSSFFINYILAKWFNIVNKAETNFYAVEAERYKNIFSKHLFARKQKGFPSTTTHQLQDNIIIQKA